MIDNYVKCARCSLNFLRSKHRVTEAVKKNWKQYCSDACQFTTRKNGKILDCSRSGCKASFYRPLKEIRKVQYSYCSRSCAAIVNNLTKPRRTWPRDPCTNKMCNKTVPRYMKFCTRICYTKARVRNDAKTLLKLLTDTALRLRRPPTKREFGPAANECVRKFGSWNAALETAGFSPNRSDDKRMYRRTRTVAADGHRCDSISEALVDNWLTEHGIPHTRDAKYPDTGHKADWSIGDRVFVEYFGLAHDSPRYDRSIREKRLLCKKHAVPLIELYPGDLYPEQKLGEKLQKYIIQPVPGP